MIKIFLSVVLIALCTVFGKVLTVKYSQRKVFYYNLFLFNERMINEVSYTKMPLAAFEKKYKFEGDFEKIIHKKANGESVAEYNLSYLSDDDKRYVYDYLQMVGKSDSASQKAYLLSVRQEAERLKTESEKEYKKYFNLYVKLGFLFGLVAVILLA